MTSFNREEFLERSMMAGSHHRAAVLAELDGLDLEPELIRELLAREWPVVDGSRGHTEAILNLFMRAGYTSDEPGFVIPTDDDGDVEIFRGNVGEDPRLGFSWTLSREQAEFFAMQPFNLRAQMLGFPASRDDGEEPVPTVWGCWIADDSILGYFNGRGEQEVIVDPEGFFYTPRVVARAEVRENASHS